MAKGRPIKRFNIPNRGLRYVVVEDNYVFFQDGSMYSLKSGHYLKRNNEDYCGCEYYSVRTKKGTNTSFAVNRNLTKFFNHELPQFDGVKHKPIKDFPNYELYSDGRVYSRITAKFLVGAGSNNCSICTVCNQNGAKTICPTNLVTQYWED